MKRAFIAIALLAVSWLPAVGYFHRADALATSVLTIFAVALLIGAATWEINRAQSIFAAILCAIAAIFLPWPYKQIPLLSACGFACLGLPIPVRWPRVLGSALVSAAVILLAQSCAFFAYMQFTARTHELPSFLGLAISWLAQSIGIDSAYDGANVMLSTMRLNYPLGATWELLIDPATFCFFFGALAWLGVRNWRGILTLLICIIVWLPARVALMLGIFLHRALRTDFDSPLVLMDQFWNASLSLLLLAGPVLMAMRFIRSPALEPARKPYRGNWLVPLLAAAAAIAIAMSIYWDPVGERQKGRIIVDEVHSQWEPTDTPFGVEDYQHNSSYTYTVLYNYLSHFYDISRQTTPIDDEALSKCDVLVLKVPTKRLASTEVAAIKKYVARGGGLMMIGEHTDVFGTGTYLNDVAQLFGFRYRYDCLFDIDEVFQQKYRPDMVAHPIVQNNPDLDFAVSCSIEPQAQQFLDRGVIVCDAARSLPADYHASNFYPQVEDRAESRYGSFVQLWATRYIDGRVIGFTDSTQFSNFCLFDPGKSELFMGMTEWLNHRTSKDDPRLPLMGIGAIAILAACAIAKGRSPGMLLVCSGALFGFAISLPTISMLQMRAMPLPQPVRPLMRVVMDRTVCDSTLPLAGFIAGKPDGFGIFERWILRLGYFTARRSGEEALHDNLLVFAYPTKDIPADFLAGVEKYVNDGGKILVIDSAENQNSTANSLLAPFPIHLKRDAALAGDLELKSTPSTQPTTAPTTAPLPIPITNAVEVVTDDTNGGEVFARVTDKPVCTTIHHGKGTVTVVGFGSRFVDLNMGFTGDNEPDPALRAVYQVEFDLLHKIIDGQ